MFLTSAVGNEMEDRGPTEGFAVRCGTPTVSGLIVALHRQEVTILMALWHEHGSCRTDMAAPTVGVGLQGLSPGHLAFGLTQI